MKVCFARTPLYSFLNEARSWPLSYWSVAEMPETKLRMWVGTVDAFGTPDQWNVDFLFRYEVFPESLLAYYGEWQDEERLMQAGDVIVLGARIPPRLSVVNLVFAVRVLHIFFSNTQVGFSYGTLAGHPETGVNEISFKIYDGDIFAEIKTKARPGYWSSRIPAPVALRPYIAYCDERALENMKFRFYEHNIAARARVHAS